MTARVGVGALLLVGLMTISANAAPPAQAQTAMILCYHIVQSPNDTKFSMSRQQFIQQMYYLKATGYHVISLADLYEYVTGGLDELPPNALVVTVDDGWRSAYTEIYPVMKDLDFPFTIFIYPKFVGQSYYAVTWKEIKEMSDNGVDIQSHTYSHPFLSRRRNSFLSDGQYQTWLNEELTESKALLEENTGKPVRFLAYPYGDYDDGVSLSASIAGYDAAVTTNFGQVKKGTNPFLLRRVMIMKDTSFATFRHYLGTQPLKLASTRPLPGNALGSDVTISATIRDFSNLDPSSVHMTLLGQSKVPYSYDPRSGSVSMSLHSSLKGNLQQAVIWGRDRRSGKRAEAVWNFYLASPPPPVEATPKSPAETTEPQPATIPERVPALQPVVPVATPVSSGATPVSGHPR
ncbi:MAG: polysaccharide deacetylase family protein [Acidobacteriota bacterium]